MAAAGCRRGCAEIRGWNPRPVALHQPFWTGPALPHLALRRRPGPPPPAWALHGLPSRGAGPSGGLGRRCGRGWMVRWGKAGLLSLPGRSPRLPLRRPQLFSGSVPPGAFSRLHRVHSRVVLLRPDFPGTRPVPLSTVPL